jgi:adhesin/invasin
MNLKRGRAGGTKRRLLVEELEPRLVLNGPSYTIPLDPTLDQFGDQVSTVQAYGDDPATNGNVTFGIFDTGASAVTFSADDQNFSLATPLPVKVPGGAVAGGIGGTITGDVSQPETIWADGMHAAQLTFDQYGFPYYNISLGASTASTPGIQSFIGTYDGSPDMPTITGTPILSPSATNPNGLAALIDMQGAVLDFSDLIPGLTLTMPDLNFAAPGVTPTVTAGATTDPFYVSLDTFGDNNYANPGDLITETPSPLQTHVSLIDGATTINGLHFLLDTGAQLTVISTAQAQTLGLDLNHPETTLDVSGVGGDETVPGFTLPELDLPTTDGGTLRFTNVPIYVLDVAPGIDGLLGMNLFDTAASMTYDPYTSRDPSDPTAGSLGLTFYTDPNRGISQVDSSTAALLQGLGVSFVDTVSGHALPGFSALSQSQSGVSLSSSTIPLGGTTTVTLTARDSFGNQVHHGGMTIAFGLGAGTAGGTFSAVTDHGDGTYTATFTGSTAGTRTITATMNGTQVTSALPSVTVLPPAAVTSVTVNGSTAPILTATEVGTTVTITTDGPHGFSAGQSVLIAGVGTGYNGAFAIATVPTPNTFTYTSSTSNLTTVSDSGTATVAGRSTGLLSGVQRSMVDSIVYVFNQPVTLAAAAFTIGVHSGQVGAAPALSWASPDGGTTWVVAFSGSGVIGNSIANGVYDLTLNGAAVSAVVGGGTLASNRIDTFYRLYGDTLGNGHQRVNLTDYSTFAGAYGTRSTDAAFLAYLDENDDGRINLTDYSALAGDYGKRYTGFTPTI